MKLKLLTIMFVTLYALPVFSNAAIKKGNLSIKPFVELKGVLDDNIYLNKKSDDAKSSFITYILPGINFNLAAKNHNFSLDYKLESLNYDYQPDKNNAIHNIGDVMANLKFPVGVSVYLKDTYKNTTDPAYNETTERIKRTENNIDSNIIMKLSEHISFGVTYAQTAYDYDSDIATYKAIERTESNMGGMLLYSISPKTSLLAEYSAGEISYKESSTKNSKTSNILVGAKGELTPKTVGQIKIGREEKTYDTLNLKPNPVLSLNIATITNFSNKQSLNLSATRKILESIYSSYYYTSTSADIKYTHKVGAKWAVITQGYYELDNYPEAISTDRNEETIYSFGLSAKYNITKYVYLCGNYTYKDRSSNDSSNIYAYTDNITSLSARFEF